MNQMQPIDPAKFQDPAITAKGEPRAHVALRQLETLWLNTGTLCNLECHNCYIESSPKNDALSWLTLAEAEAYFDEITALGLGTREIGITGGEPFMNPDIIPILESALRRGFEVLVLTNAMKPMEHCAEDLLALKDAYGDRLRLRVSIDHFTQVGHEAERGKRSWAPMLKGLTWLSAEGFALSAAGRVAFAESEAEGRDGYATLFADQDITIDARDSTALVLFPEMDANADVAEITTSCWGILNVDPNSLMCASARMVVKRKGADHPVVLACTLLPYDPQFELGPTLADAQGEVSLNHPHCAQFCVLGGASCSA